MKMKDLEHQSKWNQKCPNRSFAVSIIKNSLYNHGIESIDFIDKLLSDNDIVINDIDGNTISGILIKSIYNRSRGPQV